MAIERRLKREMDAAREAWEAAELHLQDVITHLGLPSPDGALRIKMASRESRLTLKAWRKATHRFNDFVVYGKVPDDLKDWVIDMADWKPPVD